MAEALSFGGVSSYAQVSPVSALNVSNVTLAAWIYINSFPAHNNEIMSRDWTNYRFLVDQASHQLYFIQSVSGIQRTIGSIQALLSGQWYYVACTHDGAFLRLYINGVPAAAPVSAGGSMNTSANALLIGCCNSTGWFSGIIDEVFVLNRALSDDEILFMYEQQVGCKRRVNRSKVRTGVWVRGITSAGTAIYGSAGNTSGDVAVIDEPQASDVTTLNLLATQYLTKLGIDTQSAPIKLPITAGVYLHPGDTIPLHRPDLALDRNYRITKLTKYPAEVIVEISRKSVLIQNTVKDLQNIRTLGQTLASA